jgi:hypothetical protein
MTMAKRRSRDERDEELSADEASASRDYTMARLAAARAYLAGAANDLDEVLDHFVTPDQDPKGKKRAEIIGRIDCGLELAARAVQAASQSWEDCDPEEGEPQDEPDEEDEDEEDDPDEDDED